MQIFLQILVALGFSVFWMWWYYRQDVYNKEPIGLIALIFVLSMPLSILMGLLQWAIDDGTNHRFSESNNFLVRSLFYLFVVAVSEELAKFTVVFTLIRNHKAFDEQVDGIIYAAASALGFATFENIFFISDQGDLIILLRGPASALAHILFSAMWGAALGFAKFQPDPRRSRRLIVNGILRAILTHAIFDLLISLGLWLKIEWVSLSSFVFLLFMYVLVSRQISFALRVSEFNPDNQARQTLRRLRQGRSNNRYITNPFRRKSPDTVPFESEPDLDAEPEKLPPE